MKIGDLVYLNRLYFDLFDESIGIILEFDKVSEIQGSIRMVKVGWLDNTSGLPIGWYDENELELVNGCR